MGSLERMKNSYLCRADSSGAGSALCRPPCLEPLTKKSCLAPRSIRRWRPGRPRADTASALG